MENLNRELVPKLHQSKAHIPDTFDSSDPHKLNHFLFQYWLFFHANPLQFSTDEEKINFAMTYLSSERVQKGIAHWDKQNNDVLAPNCMLKVWEEIIKDEGL